MSVAGPHSCGEATQREKAAQERVKEMEETVGDLMASIRAYGRWVPDAWPHVFW